MGYLGRMSVVGCICLLGVVLLTLRLGLSQTPPPSPPQDGPSQTPRQQARLEVKHLVATKRLGIPNPQEIVYPGGAPPSPAEIELGKTLFFDQRLSGSQHRSCATCHNPAQGFSDGRPKSVGDRGNTTTRHAPHLYNLAWSRVLFWDGRQDNLDTMALEAIKSPDEMNLPLATLVERLKAVPAYVTAFQQIYTTGLSADNIGKALGAFERSLITQNSAFDRYLRGDDAALSDMALRGLLLFAGKANCLACHDGANFTDESFRNIGVPTEDLGRGKFEAAAHFQYAFKTPGLRNVALTAPYMHDGSLNTLRDVVQFYNQGGKRRAGIDPLISPLQLTGEEVDALVAFLEALTDPITVPPPPQVAATPTSSPLKKSAPLSGEFRWLGPPPEVALVYAAEDRGLTQAVAVDQQGKAFIHWHPQSPKSLSKLVVGSPGETVTFTNSSMIGHNVYANDPRLRVQFDLGLLPPASDLTKLHPITWPAGEVLRLGCKIHPGMRLYIASLASRYYTEIEFNGAAVVPFTLETLPASVTKVAVWLPEYDPIEVAIKPGETQEVRLEKGGKPQGVVVLKRP